MGGEEKRGWAPGPVHTGPDGEALGRGRLGAWPHPWPHGPGPGPGGGSAPGTRGSFGLNYWGVLPPAHHDAKSERGIVCLDAGCCVHACVHGRHGPLMSQKRALQRPWGRGERGWVPGGLGAWVRGNCGRVCVFLGVVSATGCLDLCLQMYVSTFTYSREHMGIFARPLSTFTSFVHVRVRSLHVHRAPSPVCVRLRV